MRSPVPTTPRPRPSSLYITRTQPESLYNPLRSPSGSRGTLASLLTATPDTDPPSTSTLSAMAPGTGLPFANPPSSTTKSLVRENTRVIARFRPHSFGEGVYPVVKIASPTVHFHSPTHTDLFTFDAVYDTDASQATVYADVAERTIEDLFSGYNGTIIAYGQTGTGKSYTMMGQIDDTNHRGLIPRIAEDVFTRIDRSTGAPEGSTEYTVLVSYLEIYMETLRDLLLPPTLRAVPLTIKNDPSLRCGPHVTNLTTLTVGSAAELYAILRMGARARAVAPTALNLESSRSHAICQLTLTRTPNAPLQPHALSLSLFLVDLAGSEKVLRTRASGLVLEEAKKINASLSALGNVIYALTDPRALHVPYRDSKLTRLLANSLGGNSRTSLIVNCSPANSDGAETLGSLRFGRRAKRIRNAVQRETPEVQEAPQLEAARAAVAQKEEEIRVLQRRLEAVVDENLALKQGMASAHSERAAGSGGVESESATRLAALVERFAHKLTTIEAQNASLRQSILASQETSARRHARVQELEQALREQQALVARESETFEAKLSVLRTRVAALKATPHFPTPQGGSTELETSLQVAHHRKSTPPLTPNPQTPISGSATGEQFAGGTPAGEGFRQTPSRPVSSRGPDQGPSRDSSELDPRRVGLNLNIIRTPTLNGILGSN